VANRLPQFTISGAVGASATNFAALLNPAASLWTRALLDQPRGQAHRQGAGQVERSQREGLAHLLAREAAT
jgi:hypothetical protein